MNTVRKHVSAVKGGRTARVLAGSSIVNLTVSDVAGDVLDAITDPTVQDTTSRDDAVNVLIEHGLWDRVDPTIQAHLRGDDAESPSLSGAAIQTVLVATGDMAAGAMLRRADELGLRGERVPGDWGGEGADFGRHLVGLMSTAEHDVLVGCGGETTVRLDGWGSAGKGGPNQEVAVSAALAMDGERPMALIALDTDGSDGASRYAGGLVDDLTGALWETSGVDVASLLGAHEVSAALETIGQAVDTGATLTNVNDLFVVVTGR